MYRIAIVEDNKPANDQFMGYVKKIWSDCQVDQFYEVEPAVAALSRENYDLVISDIDLGTGSDRWGGIKVTATVRPKEVPILIISGLPQPELNREIFGALDVWDYLQKPVSETDFINQVKRAITYVEGQTKIAGKGRTVVNTDPNIVIDLHSRTRVTWKGKRVSLSLTQIRLLETLLAKINQCVAFEDLYEQIDTGRNKENLRVHIRQIRSAFLEADPAFNRLTTVPYRGYSWHV